MSLLVFRSHIRKLGLHIEETRIVSVLRDIVGDLQVVVELPEANDSHRIRSKVQIVDADGCNDTGHARQERIFDKVQQRYEKICIDQRP